MKAYWDTSATIKVYDFGHALAADKAQVDELITRNAADFSGLTKARLEWP